jgi:hypothetical protein
MLANVEDRLFLDPTGSMESMTFEAQKEKLKTKLHRVTLEKPKITVTGADVSSNSHKIEEEEDAEEEVDVPKPVSFIVLNVDPYVSKNFRIF